MPAGRPEGTPGSGRFVAPAGTTLADSLRRATPCFRRLYERCAFVFALGVLGLTGVAYTTVSSVLYWLLPRAVGEALGRKGIGNTFRVYFALLRALGLARLDLRALDGLAHEDALVIAPNHPSLLDAVLVVSRLPDTVCVMKSAVLDNFFLGAGARLAGYIPADAPKTMIRHAVAALQAGRHVLVFPEGTRTVGVPVNEFKGSLAPIARLARAHVQTVFIETSSPYLGKGWPLLRMPQLPLVYRIRLGARFAPREDSGRFVADLEAYFRRELGDRPR
jgi:1-acyl-sn-glycerol-3-phosphate acyltransferase